MSSIWQSYVPYHVAHDLALHPAADPIGREQRFEAVALFADVSGFTAISEALGAEGKNGTEELTRILNSYFGPMIDLIRSYGGIIGKFGGDAMTVVFPYTPATYESVVRGAVQCALEMQAKMVNYAAIPTAVGSFSLAMKAGLAAGPLFCTIVGDPTIRLEYLITGAVLDACAEAEHHASKGEVVIQPDLLPAIRASARYQMEDGFALVQALADIIIPAGVLPLPEPEPQVIDSIAAFMHPSIAQRLRDQRASFINEHRRVTVLFVSFQSFDYDRDPQVGARLQDYLAQVIQIVHRYDGYLNKVDMGDKGSKYIALFGAPIAHEDDEERALRCALELRDLPGVPVRIGVNTGFVYCGQVGSDLRQEYTVMGDAVNLAARLMQAARPDQILVSTASYSAAYETFAWEEEAAIQVKGKTGTVGIHTLLQLKRQVALQLQEPVYTLPMVGREAELAQIGELLRRVQQAQGQVVGITAEAGMGKSRLAAEVIKMATDQGLVGYGGECLSHGVNTSYLVWHNLLRGLFGLDPAWTSERQIARLEAQLAKADAQLAQRMPLLGRALNLPIPDNELTRGMDAKLRKASLEALLVESVRYRAGRSPLLLVLEDCHWIDALSNDLLEAIGRNVADVPVLMLVIYRPAEVERIQPQVTRLGHFSEIRLAEFTRAEAERLIELKLETFFGTSGEFADEFVERITERAQGNPFYIDEMINLIRDRGIEPTDTAALQSLDIPDSLHSLIISRLDQLAEGPKTTLKVASVIGRLFRADWLWAVYPQLGAPQQVKEQMALLSRLDITPLDRSEPQELEYLFKHIVTREVAYESLALATRTMLHEQIGLHIERTYAESRDSFIDLLAYHFGLSHNVEKQRQYFRQAGSLAQSAFANQAAIDYYQRLLPILSEPEQGGILLELGQVQQLIGEWTEAEETYQVALQIAAHVDDPQTQAQAERALGTLFRFKGSYVDALSWLERALVVFEALDDQPGVCQTLTEIGIVHWGQGDYALALERYQQCLQIATAASDRRNAYRAVGNIGGIYMMQGKNDLALSSFEQSHQSAIDLGDRLGAGVAIGNMGAIHLAQGDYGQALASFAQYLRIAQELGYRQGISISVGNMGEVYEKQGDYSRAVACHAYSLRATLEIGDWVGVSLALWSMGKTYIWQERYTESKRLLLQAVALGRALDIAYELCEYLHTQADLEYHQEQYEVARQLNEESGRIANEVQHQDMQFMTQVLGLRLRVALNELPAVEAIDQLNDLLVTWTARDSQAALHYQIWQLDNSRVENQQQAAQLYRELYRETPYIMYRHRYQRLGAGSLPDPAPLLPLPPFVASSQVELESLLLQVDALISELT